MSNSRVTSYSVNAAVGSSMIRMPRILRQRAQDFDALAIADAERADDPVRRQIVDFERGEQRLGLGSRIARQSSRPPRPRGAWPMKTFSATVSSGNSSSS